jgi:hypothetical protein
MNSPCLESDPISTSVGATVAGQPGSRGPAVAPVRAIRPQSGLLACLESIARDRRRPASQQALLQRFPRRCRRFQADEGRVEYRDALELMAELGLADSFETVREVPGIADLGERVGRGIILCVPAAGGGEPRWWRIASVGGTGIRAMRPESEDPAVLTECAWSELERAGAWAVALD